MSVSLIQSSVQQYDVKMSPHVRMFPIVKMSPSVCQCRMFPDVQYNSVNKLLDVQFPVPVHVQSQCQGSLSSQVLEGEEAGGKEAAYTLYQDNSNQC